MGALISCDFPRGEQKIDYPCFKKKIKEEVIYIFNAVWKKNKQI